jgi:minichromosome maintenance protein 10
MLKQHHLNSPSVNKLTDLEKKSQVAKQIKSEILLSLNTSIGQQALVNSPILSNVAFKTNKRSDKELMALLGGKELDKEEVKRITIAEQQASVKYSNSAVHDKANNEMSRLFSSKALLPNETNCNNTISSRKLVDLKKSNEARLGTDANADTYSNKLREKYEENKKLYNLSTLQSHKDIIKEMKKLKENNKKTVEVAEEVDVVQVASFKPLVADKPVVKDFLKKQIDAIKRMKSSQPVKLATTSAANVGFDLELFIGDKLVTQKLLDVSTKYKANYSPSSGAQKRKNDQEIEQNSDEKRAKKLKMIDDLLNIKSSHAKDVMDPDKNPHVKAYFEKMQQQEAIDDKLCNVRNREVRVVSCKQCDYTYFSQSDFCKLKKHNISRHMVLQRFFKCKSCKMRTFTLDQLCPVKSCKQCGSDKFEPSTMKEQDTSILGKDKTNLNLNQESEYLIDLQN